jgi:hypothetical protein
MSIDKNFRYGGNLADLLSKLDQYIYSCHDAGAVQWILQYNNKWMWLSPYPDEKIFNIKFSHKMPQESVESFLLILEASGYDEVT